MVPPVVERASRFVGSRGDGLTLNLRCFRFSFVTESSLQERSDRPSDRDGPRVDELFEVFVRPRRGLDFVHCGSVRAPDAAMALERARTLFARRGEVGGMWLLPASAIVTSPVDDAEVWFGPHTRHPCREAGYYQVPEGVRGL